MLKTRVIPALLLRGAGLVKTTAFKNPVYVGDPINAIRIFNEKEVDELVLLDIAASRTGSGPAFSTIESIASECFMPVAYGGGITTIEQVRRILGLGVEKVVINAAALANPQFVEKAPVDVLEKSRAKLVEAELALAKLDEAINRLGV